MAVNYYVQTMIIMKWQYFDTLTELWSERSGYMYHMGWIKVQQMTNLSKLSLERKKLKHTQQLKATTTKNKKNKKALTNKERKKKKKKRKVLKFYCEKLVNFVKIAVCGNCIHSLNVTLRRGGSFLWWAREGVTLYQVTP